MATQSRGFGTRSITPPSSPIDTYWKTPTLNEEFVELASPILWCYEQIERLVERNEVIVCWAQRVQAY